MRRLHSTSPAACRRRVGAQSALPALCACVRVVDKEIPMPIYPAPVPAGAGVEVRKERVVDGVCWMVMRNVFPGFDASYHATCNVLGNPFPRVHASAPEAA